MHRRFLRRLGSGSSPWMRSALFHPLPKRSPKTALPFSNASFRARIVILTESGICQSERLSSACNISLPERLLGLMSLGLATQQRLLSSHLGDPIQGANDSHLMTLDIVNS